MKSASLEINITCIFSKYKYLTVLVHLESNQERDHTQMPAAPEDTRYFREVTKENFSQVFRIKEISY